MHVAECEAGDVQRLEELTTTSAMPSSATATAWRWWLLDEEADRVAGAGRYERSPDREEKGIHAQEDRVSAVQKAAHVGGGEAGDDALGAEFAETLEYMSFLREHWRCIRTNSPLERLNREVRRRTRVVGAFPDGRSALMLVAARLGHTAGYKVGDAEVSGYGQAIRGDDADRAGTRGRRGVTGRGRERGAAATRCADSASGLRPSVSGLRLHLITA